MRQGVHRTVPRAEPLELRRQQRRQSVPAGDDWLHEPKLDGYRLQVVKSGGKIRPFSRPGNDGTSRLPGSAEALTGIPASDVILDAELCLPRADGRPNFYGLQAAIAGGGSGSAARASQVHDGNCEPRIPFPLEKLMR